MSEQQARGFTLIEVLVSVAVTASVLAFAFPAMQAMQSNARMASTANDLASDLKRGRSGAVANRNNFTVTAQAGGWSNGWQATYVIASNAAENSTSLVQLALQKTGLPAGVTITQSVNPLIFNGTTGRVTDVSGSSVDVVFKVCDSKVSSEVGFNVMLNRFGRVLIQRHTNSTACSI